MFALPQYSQYFTHVFNGKRPHPKSKFTPEEDEKLKLLVNEHGEKHWDLISKKMKTRNPRQCKERWFNYLSPKINFLPWTNEEDQKLEKIYNEIGPKWVKITHYFPARTDVNIKNRWMVLQRQKKKLEKKARKLESESLKEDSFDINDKKFKEDEDLISNLVMKNDNDDINDCKVINEQFNIDPLDVFHEQCFDYLYFD